MRTFTSQLIDHLTYIPDKEILHFQKTGMDDIHLSYRAIIGGSKKYSDALEKEGILPGEVVVIILQHSLDLIFAYFGTILNGSIPSIMPFLTEKLLPEKYNSDFLTLIEITKPTAIITYDEFYSDIKNIAKKNEYLKTILLSEYIKGQPYISAEIPDLFANGLKRSSEDIALLQHSSGSTGLQKGVALSHQAIFNQIESYSKAIKLSQDDVIVSWLPLYHDMGLIACFLMPILFGTPLVLMSPFDWVRAPHRLLRAISEYEGTLCWLPNFAYNFCAKKIREDELKDINLQFLRAVINCSEPMRFESHELFYDRFFPYKLQKDALATCYAMAENVFAVTQGGVNKPVTYDKIDQNHFQLNKYAKPVSKDELSMIMVSAGSAIDQTQIRIIDEKGNFLEDRYLGEIVIKSNCMLTEYYNREEDTKNSFINEWFKTGDLGYIANDNLFISGRKKDLIIVGGKNIYPQDIENIVSSVDGIHPGRTVAFGIFNDEKGTEDVVVIAEIENNFLEKKNEIVMEIKRLVTQSTAIALRSVYLIEEKWLIKTSSGKIARSANKEKYIKEIS